MSDEFELKRIADALESIDKKIIDNRVKHRLKTFLWFLYPVLILVMLWSSDVDHHNIAVLIRNSQDVLNDLLTVAQAN